TVPRPGLSRSSRDLHSCHHLTPRQRDHRSGQPRRDSRRDRRDSARNSNFFPHENRSNGKRQLANGECRSRCRAVTEFSCRTQDPDATFWLPSNILFRDNMLKTRLFLTVVTALALVTGASARLLAQGVTTGAVSGTVTDPSGGPIEGAQVQLRNSKTGFSAGGITRSNGQYNIQGVE